MESAPDQPAARSVAAGGSKLRYPLRSAAKPKEGRLGTVADASSSSASRRGTPSSVSKSVNVLDLSGRDRSARPPRRLSVPSKNNASPRPAAPGSITPISETRMRKSANNQGKSDTPISDTARSGRRKFCVLSSVSYWLTQIKLSEGASKHSISLGFFKLALESGCEPLQRVREELKSYARRHNLVGELGQPAKDLLQSYNLLEDLEELKISETSSQLPQEGSQNLADNVPARSGSLKPKSLNSETFADAEPAQKKQPASRNRVSSNKHPTSLGNHSQKKHQKPSKGGPNEKVKSSTKKSATEKVNSVDALPNEEASRTEVELHEDKENLDAALMERNALGEEIQTC